MGPSDVPVVTSSVANTTSLSFGVAGVDPMEKELTVVWPHSSPLPRPNVRNAKRRAGRTVAADEGREIRAEDHVWAR